MDLAAKVSAQVDLESIRLVESMCALGEASGPGPVSVDFSASGDTRVDDSSTRIVVTVRFAMVAKRDEAPQGGAIVVKINAAFQLRYKLATSDGLEKKHIDAFGKLNGMFNAWPYWREFVQSMTARMGLPTLVVPLLKVGVSGTKNSKEPSRRPSRSAR